MKFEVPIRILLSYHERRERQAILYVDNGNNYDPCINLAIEEHVLPSLASGEDYLVL